MGLEEKLYDWALGCWALQENSYDIQNNFPDLLNFEFDNPELTGKLASLTTRCQEILNSETPLPEPDVDAIFRENIAPVPNNSIINVVTRAIMAGGTDFPSKLGGWRFQGDDLFYEVRFEKAGTITVSIEDCQEPIELVQSMSLFTLDVFIGVLGHLGFTYCGNRTRNPLSQETQVTSRQILRYKNIRSYGKKRWDLFEKIQAEISKLNKLRINVEEGRTRNGSSSYRAHLILTELIKRDFNPFTKQYVTSSWFIRPGRWAVYHMSKDGYQFIGKLDHKVFKYDHREQRGAQYFAKKLVYALFVVPGGTFYVTRGTKKSLWEYLQLIGEYREGGDIDRKKKSRDIKRLGKAIDFLVDQGLIRTNMKGSVHEHITQHCKPWNMEALLRIRVDIKMTGSG